MTVGRLLPGLLVQTSGEDPAMLGAVAALLDAVASSCLNPARRATRLDAIVV